MANDRYTHTRGHEPLRVPQGWREQERAFVIQLERILTDIYQRFGSGKNDLSGIYSLTVTELKGK